MVNSWDNQLRQVQSTVAGFFGESALYTPAAGGSSTTITVVQAQAPTQIMVGDEDGQQSDRLIYLEVPISAVPTPARGDVYVLSGAGNAGTWTGHRVEKFNNVKWLIACRQMVHPQIGGRTAQQVRT